MPSHELYPSILAKLVERADLSREEAAAAMVEIITGNLSDSQIAAFLIALRVKGESTEEILGFRDAIMANTTPITFNQNLLDIVGTGGDPYGALINVSSVSSIVVAACGVPVAKHGNRAASSKSGASDLLSALGINLDLTPHQVQNVLEAENITFIFAAKFHGGFRHAAAVRKEISIPTIFNILGPLCNPASPRANAVGVSNADRLEQVADVFSNLGVSALVFRGQDGLDKLTTTSVSRVFEVSAGRKLEHVVDPARLGIRPAVLTDLFGAGPEENAAIARGVLEGNKGPCRDIVALNAAAGLVAYDLENDPALIECSLTDRLKEKLKIAENSIDSGSAAEKLKSWIKSSNLPNA